MQYYRDHHLHPPYCQQVVAGLRSHRAMDIALAESDIALASDIAVY